MLLLWKDVAKPDDLSVSYKNRIKTVGRINALRLSSPVSEAILAPIVFRERLHGNIGLFRIDEHGVLVRVRKRPLDAPRVVLDCDVRNRIFTKHLLKQHKQMRPLVLVYRDHENASVRL